MNILENVNKNTSGKKRKKFYNEEKRKNYDNKFRLMIERTTVSPDVQIF